MTDGTGGTGVSGALGYLGMIGGALFVVVYVALSAFGEATFGTAYTFQVMSAVPVLFWVGGTVGLYLRHRGAFGWIGRIGTTALLVGFVPSLLNSAGILLTGDPLLPTAAQWGYLVAETGGALLFGAAVVRTRELPHAVAGGLLFALGLPTSLVLYIVLFQTLELLSNPILGALLFTVPFGTAWVLLGLDLVAERDEMTYAAAANEEFSPPG